MTLPKTNDLVLIFLSLLDNRKAAIQPVRCILKVTHSYLNSIRIISLMWYPDTYLHVYSVSDNVLFKLHSVGRKELSIDTRCSHPWSPVLFVELTQ